MIQCKMNTKIQEMQTYFLIEQALSVFLKKGVT